MTPQALFVALAPALFVVIWSTGWIAAKYVAPFADPLTFLAVRFAAAGVLLAVFAQAMRAPWPQGPMPWLHVLVSGVLLHAVYLGGVWWAIAHGMSAGMSGLVAALQPLLTAVWGYVLLHERLTARQWLGIAVGLVGVSIVLSPKLVGAGPMADLRLPLAINLLAMLSITAGTLYQKRFLAKADLRTATVGQYIGATAAVLPVALLTEELRFTVGFQTLAGLAWSVIVLSIGGIALLLAMINRGQVARVASLNYLVPSIVALIAWWMFGETLSLLQLGGMVVTAAGVYLATGRR